MADDFSSVRVHKPCLSYDRKTNGLVVTIPVSYSESLRDETGATVYRNADPSKGEVQRISAVVANPLVINGRVYAEWSHARIESMPGREGWWLPDNIEGFTDSAQRKLIAHILANVTIPPMDELFSDWTGTRRSSAEAQKETIDYETNREIEHVGRMLQPHLQLV